MCEGGKTKHFLNLSHSSVFCSISPLLILYGKYVELSLEQCFQLLMDIFSPLLSLLEKKKSLPQPPRGLLQEEQSRCMV